jgi:hypothetical protein
MKMKDYLDPDVAYLLGMLVARGELSTSQGVFRIVVHFPKGNLTQTAKTLNLDPSKEIPLGMQKIRERLLELTGGDARTIETNKYWDLDIHLTRNTITWRNLTLLLEQKTSYEHFTVPEMFLNKETALDIKKEFVRGYADVAGHIRKSNRDQAGRHRVYLDILNYQTNWQLPVKICLLLQVHLKIPVPVITWGHPNLNRQWREHQLKVYAEDFLPVGFYFDYKQRVLEELAKENAKRFASHVRGCPGERAIKGHKARHPEEKNAERLPKELVGKHFDAYWQICRELGCTMRPIPGEQLELIEDN